MRSGGINLLVLIPTKKKKQKKVNMLTASYATNGDKIWEWIVDEEKCIRMTMNLIARIWRTEGGDEIHTHSAWKRNRSKYFKRVASNLRLDSRISDIRILIHPNHEINNEYSKKSRK